MPRYSRFSLAILGLSLAGCASIGHDPVPPPRIYEDTWPIEATTAFQRGLDEMARLDKTRGWTPETCASVAATFKRAVDEMGRPDRPFTAAEYNVGVAYQRCGDVDRAASAFRALLARDSKNHRARVQLARIAMARGGADTTDVINDLRRAVLDSEYQNVEAFVEIARLQMQRGNVSPDDDGANDFERASKNLRRALAVDDGYMPAFNQLAIFYLESAKRRSGRSRSGLARDVGADRSASQELDPAFLVASQAMKKDPTYAPIRNTLGLLFVESGDLSKAANAFAAARKLDPSFFEAHVNYASVNLLFRGFKEAEEAYRTAIKLHPTDYDAHIGLALALRGQIDAAQGGEAKLAEAEVTLKRAKQLDAARPEAYFNEAILVESYGARRSPNASVALARAISLYEEFVKKARGKPEFASSIEDVVAVPKKKDDECATPGAAKDPGCKRGRIYDLREMISFDKESRGVK